MMEDKYAKKAVKFGASNTDNLGMEGLSSDLRKKQEEAELNKPKSRLEKKMSRIFGTVGDVKTVFFRGFQMGAMVGGIFGGLMGTYYSIVYRTIWYIPMLAVGSGSSFGFFMGIGMVIRSEMAPLDSEDGLYHIQTIDSTGVMHS